MRACNISYRFQWLCGLTVGPCEIGRGSPIKCDLWTLGCASVGAAGGQRWVHVRLAASVEPGVRRWRLGRRDEWALPLCGWCGGKAVKLASCVLFVGLWWDSGWPVERRLSLGALPWPVPSCWCIMLVEHVVWIYHQSARFFCDSCHFDFDIHTLNLNTAIPKYNTRKMIIIMRGEPSLMSSVLLWHWYCQTCTSLWTIHCAATSSEYNVNHKFWQQLGKVLHNSI